MGAGQVHGAGLELVLSFLYCTNVAIFTSLKPELDRARFLKPKKGSKPENLSPFDLTKIRTHSKTAVERHLLYNNRRVLSLSTILISHDLTFIS